MDFSNSHQESHGTKPLCHCLGIHAEEIQAHIAEHDLASVRGVTKSCGAGGGCTSCHRHIKRMLHDHAVQRREAAQVDAALESLLGCA